MDFQDTSSAPIPYTLGSIKSTLTVDPVITRSVYSVCCHGYQAKVIAASKWHRVMMFKLGEKAILQSSGENQRCPPPKIHRWGIYCWTLGGSVFLGRTLGRRLLEEDFLEKTPGEDSWRRISKGELAMEDMTVKADPLEGFSGSFCCNQWILWWDLVDSSVGDFST